MLNGWNSSVRTTSAMISASTTILTVSHQPSSLAALPADAWIGRLRAFGSLMDRSSLVDGLEPRCFPRLLYKPASGAPSGGY